MLRLRGYLDENSHRRLKISLPLGFLVSRSEEFEIPESLRGQLTNLVDATIEGLTKQISNYNNQNQ